MFIASLDAIVTKAQRFRGHAFKKGGHALTATVSNEMFRRPTEKREGMRFDVALPATAMIMGKDYSVRVLNVALGGAMFETSAPLAARSRLIFRCGTIRADATVAWQSGGCTGVRFDRLLSVRDVAEQLSRSSAVAARRELKLDRR